MDEINNASRVPGESIPPEYKFTANTEYHIVECSREALPKGLSVKCILLIGEKTFPKRKNKKQKWKNMYTIKDSIFKISIIIKITSSLTLSHLLVYAAKQRNLLFLF